MGLLCRVASAALIAAPLSIFTFTSSDALACGGFFCSTTPVMQTGEKIVFAIDEQANTVDVIIEIQYAGEAENFAWVLPLLSAPTHMGIGTTRMFQQIDVATAPAFIPQITYGAKCRFGGGSDAAFSVDAAAPNNPSVIVLAQEQVGPYDSVVIQSTDPQAIRSWLEDADYRVTDQMMESVRPYVLKGDALLALKLAKNEVTGSLQPFSVRLNSNEPCIPLRMTSIAASADMAVTALVLSNQGRAIPANYLHVVPNWARINWLSPFSSYRELIGEAANDAGGNAFATEFSGPASVMRNLISTPSEYNLEAVRSATTAAAMINVYVGQSLNRRSEAVGLLRKYITDELLQGVGLDPVFFWQCPNCYLNEALRIPIDASMFAAELEERVIAPDRDVQGLFDRFEDLTRMYTLISPEEMMIDPIFEFRADLPEVNRVHRAEVHYECGDSGALSSAQVRVTLEDGTIYYTDSSGRPTMNGPQLPATALIEDLKEGTIVIDNREKIDTMLKETLPDRSGSGCSCDAAGGGSALASTLLIALGAVFAARRRRS